MKARTNVNQVMPLSTHDLPYHLMTAGIFVFMKMVFRQSNVDDVVFLLKPTDKLVKIMTTSPSEFISGIGYYHEDMNFIVDKSCSGFNFWILCFVLFMYLTIKHVQKSISKMLAFPIILTIAYMLTILVNTCRIYTVAIVQNYSIHWMAFDQAILHEAIGIVTHLSFLLISYYFIEKLLLKTQQQNAHLS